MCRFLNTLLVLPRRNAPLTTVTQILCESSLSILKALIVTESQVVAFVHQKEKTIIETATFIHGLLYDVPHELADALVLIFLGIHA